MKLLSTITGKSKLTFCIVLFLISLIPAQVLAQLDVEHYIPPVYGRENKGTHFIVLSTPNSTPFPVTITNGAGTIIATPTISSAASFSYYLGAGEATEFLVTEAELNTVMTNEGLILTAAEPFYVNLRVFEGAQAGSLISKGSQAAFGQDFWAGHMFNNNGYDTGKSNSFGIMATSNNTTVTISNISPGVIFRGTTPLGTPLTTPSITITLNAGESYVISNFMDEANATNNTNGANGTHITSDKDIVVNCATWLGGNARTGTTPTSPISNGRDIGIDQIVPVETVGDEYVLIKGEGIDNERTIVVATAANTDIFLNGNATPSITLANAGDFYIIEGTAFHPLNENLYLTSSSPVYLYQTTNGGDATSYDNERQNGLMFLPPVGCSGGKDVFLPNVDSIGTAYINIIANLGANIYVNGVLQGNGDTIAGTTDYVTYKLTSGYTGDVRITSDQLIRVALINLSGNIGASGYFSGFTKDFNVQTNTVNGDNIALEGCIPASFTFGIDAPITTPTILTYQVWGSATNGVDYNLIDTSLTIPAGQTQATIFINSIQDGIPEGQETVMIVYQPDLCSPLDTAILYIDDAQPIVFTLDETDLSCFENSTGEIQVNASGGFPPYTYDVNGPGGQINDTLNPITGLSAGTYTVQVYDIYGCKAQALVVGGVFDADTLFLPDGSGVTYTTQIPITGFGSGETIDSLSQIQQICATMEHSYLGDLELKIISPTGQSIILKEYPGGGSCDLGEPFAAAPVDGANSNLTDPGVGYEYCWNSTPTFVTMVGESNNFTHTIPSSTGGTYTDNFLPPGSYEPFEPLSNLLGSSMDGNWTMEITDNLGLDNGYVFEWNISLVGALPDTTVIINEPDSVQMNGTITQAQCGGNDGAINFSANGIHQPFTYLWSNGATTEDITALSAGNYTVIVTDTTGCSDSTTFNLNNISSINITSTITDVTCTGGNNGDIVISTSGGTMPYTFSWDNGETTENISTLSAGNYLLSITDAAGCQFSESITLGTLPSIVISLNNSTNEFCGQVNGSLDINVSGGSGSYGYSWDNGSSSQDLSNISGGTYEVTVTDANSCQSVQSFDILNDVSNCSAYCFLTVSSTVIDENCGDGTGTIDVTVSQATQPYIVSWNTGETIEDLSNLNAGTYTITVTDANQCVEIVDIQVGNNTGNLAISANQINNENCGNSDGSIDVNISGGTLPYTFSWDNGASTEDISSLTADSYTITVTDGNGCSLSSAFNVINNTGTLTATATLVNEICSNTGGSINLTPNGNAGTLSYLWSNGAISQDIVGLSAGLYSCTITDANGCILETQQYNLINESSTLLLTNTVINNEDCNNGQGDIDITIQGGTIPLTFAWGNGATTEDISSLSSGTYSCTITDGNGCQVQTGTLNLFNSPGDLNVTTDLVTNEICNNNAGAITVTTTGGSAPITYSWDNGSTSEDISGLTSGSYNLTVTDANGCIFNHSESISNTAGTLQIDNAVLTHENCNDGSGSINLIISGGSAPFTYNWDNGATIEDISSLSAGNYFITVTDANGCQVSENYTINNITGTLAVTSIGTAEFCSNNNGEIDITVTGGTGPYTYLWNNGATTEDLTGIAGGTYSCTITDVPGCNVLTGNITINNNPGTLVLAAATSNESCANGTGTINLNISGGAPGYTFVWSPNVSSNANATNLSAGMYYYTVSDINGCSITDSSEIFNDAGTLSLDIFSVIDEICGNGLGEIDLTVSGGTAPVTYLWSNGATTEDLTGLPTGIFSCTITDANGCSINSGNINVSDNPGTLAIDNILINDESCGNALGAINITISGGATPYSFLWNTGATTEDLLTGLSAGNYTCDVTDANGCSVQVQATVQNTQGTLYTISNIVTDESCGTSNGEINLNPQGGTTPYTFVWSNGATSEDLSGISAGNYSVTITDNGGCTLTEDFTIINNGASLNIENVTINNEICGNSAGAIDISIQGGDAPFTFAWNNGSTTEDLSGVSAGNYSLTVTDANGCSTNGLYVIDENTGTLAITNFTLNNEACGDASGSIDLTITTTTIVDYDWSNGATTEDITGLNAGIYSVTITDANGCTVDSTGNIQNITGGFSANITSVTDENCGDTTGIIDITVSGGSLPYTFAWNNTATSEDLSNLSAGNYSVIITDAAGCSTNIDTIVNNISGTLAITNVVINNESCSDGTGFIDLTVTGTSTPITFLWSNGAITEDLAGLSAGTYSVTITDATGCDLLASYDIIDNSGGLNTNITMNDEVCGASDGNITALVSGGAAPYIISWTGGVPTNCCTYTLDMQDAGNSWNGASIDVLVNGLNIGNYTVAGGGANIETFNICTGDALELIWNPGAFDNEISFDLLGGSGAILFSQGPSPFPGSIYNSVANCPSGSNNPSSLNNITAGEYIVDVTDDFGCLISDTITVNNIFSFTVSAALTDENCSLNNGAIDLTITGGTAPFTFNWTNGAITEDISGLAAGTYIASISDASGCSILDTFIINNNFTFTTSDIITNDNCNLGNGAIDYSVTGGTSPFTFVWSNGTSNEDVSNLSAGAYTVTTTDASGCMLTDTFTINSIATFTTVATVTNDNCGQSIGEVDLTVTGGVAPFTHNWSNGATTEDLSGLNSGMFIVTTNDAVGCSVIDTFTITNTTTFTYTATSKPDSCGLFNGAIDLNLNGGSSPFTFNWSNGAITEDISGLSAGNYSVTITDTSGCAEQTTFTVNSSASFTTSGTIINDTCGLANGAIDLSLTNGISCCTFTLDLQDSFGDGWDGASVDVNINGSLFGNFTIAGGNSSIESISVCDGDLIELSYNSGAFENEHSYTLLDGDGDVLFSATAPPTTGSVFSTTVNCSPSSPIVNYSWSNGETTEDLTNLLAGTYSVTIIDPSTGCSAIDSFTVTNTSTFTVFGNTTDDSCNVSSGTIDLNIAGGSTPYTFVWSNGATTEDISGISAGNYSVTITDAANCSSSESFSIGNTSSFSYISSVINDTCNSGTGAINLSLTGGTAPYTFVWNNGATTEDISGLSADNYNVTISDASGCSAVESFTINNISLFNVSESIIGDSCSSSNGSIDLIISGGSTPFTFAWSNGATTEDISGLSAGNYSVTITDASGCSIMKMLTINNTASFTSSGIINDDNCNLGIGAIDLTINSDAPCCTYTLDMQDSGNSWNGASIDVFVNGANIGNYTVFGGGANTGTFDVCDGDTIVLVWNTGAFDNEVSYNLLDGSSNIVFSQGASPSPGPNYFGFASCPNSTPSVDYIWNNGANTEDISGLNSGTYSVIITDQATGCFITDTFSVINTSSFTYVSVITDDNCNSGLGAIDLTPSGGTTPFTFNWSNGAITEDITGLTSGTYYITITDASNCASVDSFTINNNTSFSYTSITTDDNCNTSTGTIDLSLTGGTSPYTFIWSNGAITEDLSGLLNGTYSVTISDASGCTAIDSFIINNNTTFSYTSITTDDNCNTSTGTIDLSLTGGTSPYTFIWSNGATTEDLSGLSNGIYSVTISDASGCSALDSFTINNTTTYSYNSVITDDNCNFGIGGIDLTITGGSSPYTFVWNNGESTEDIINLNGGIYSVIISDASGCTATDSFNISNSTTFTYTSVINNDSCNLGIGSIDLSVSGTNAPHWFAWSNGARTEDISGLNPGTYYVTITDASNCSALDSFVVNGITLDDATYSYSATSFCQTDSDPIPTINGTIGGTFTSTTGLSLNPNTGEIDLSLSTIGNYGVLYTTSGTCPDTLTAFITITDCTLPTVSFSASDSTICKGGCINFSDLSTNSPTNWIWYFTGSSQTTVVGISSPTNICYDTAGTYPVKLIVFNSSGSDSLELVSFITVLPSPTITTSIDTAICESENVTISATGGTTYIWDNGLGLGQTHSVSPTTTSVYTVSVTDVNGCTANDSVTVSINTASPVYASNDVIICIGTSTTIFATGSSSYDWSNGLGSASSTTVSPDVSTTYIVTGSDTNGCVSTDQVTVSINQESCLDIPTAFSPNGDGQNDLWNIAGKSEYPDIVVKVFNRWGSEVFSSDQGYTSPWDGAYNGTDVPPATYYYIIELGNGEEPRSGTINIIR
ncbi:gliding motility-associated C-terminal domain-containing protein [Vicingaceae bacterium]|nr:gliding motility-associated C-terminal domain-containing protein [Vicingaceae bacterium]